MYTLRRWWDYNGVKLLATLFTLGSAWFIRQTHGVYIMDLYGTITRPLVHSSAKQDAITNAQVLELQERLVEIENQNQVLRNIIGITSTSKSVGVIAPVIGRSPDQWWHQIILGRGQAEGITVNSIVMSQGGLVGRVIKVGSTTSRVLLLSDPASRVGVVVSRSRAMGFLRGQGSNRALLTFFEKVPDVKPGDVISTSTYSQLFPSSLPIGQIESVDYTKSPAPEAVIALTAPVNYLEWVTVHQPELK
ncbi:MAG: rod shape-determining protein MreC [Cyanobacteria bacterium REEB444]|nr:rod shape-determining protein MreC [Cyanobacteria bacterium REEB444]